MQKIADLNNAQLLTRGLYPDLPKNQAQLFFSGSNIDFDVTGVVKTRGNSYLDNVATPIYAIAQSYVNGLRRAYFAEADKLWSWTVGGKAQIGSGYGGLGYWSMVPWGSWLIATNDFDVPQVWKDDGNPASALADVRRPRFRLVKRHQNRILGFFGQSVDWSSDSNPELWDPAENNSAGGQLIRDLDSDITAACQLSTTNLGVYSFDKMVVMSYIGSPFFYGFPTTIPGIGAWNDSGVMQVGNRNYGFGPKGFWTTDGISFDYIDRPQIKNWVLTQLDKNNSRRIVGVHDSFMTMVKWWFPCLDGVIRGVGFNYKDPAWTIYEQPFTAAVEQEVFDFPLIANGTTFGYYSSPDLGAAPLPTSLTSFPFDATQRFNYKLWDAIQLDYEGTGLEMRFGFADNPDDVPEWTAWAPAVKGYNYINRESVLITFDFRSTALGDDWKVTGATIWGEVTGYAN